MTGEWQRRKNIMLCYPFEEKRLLKWKPPYLCQPKFDGERCRAVPVKDGYLLLSSEENVFWSVPHINEALKAFTNTDIEFDGELYCHGMSFEEIVSRVSRTKNKHPDSEAIGYHIFDIADENQSQLARSRRLLNLFKNLKHPASLVLSPIDIVDNLDEVMRHYHHYINKGYEGIIVRNLNAPYLRRKSPWVMKFKPAKTDEYTIIGFKEEISKDGVPKGSLGAFRCIARSEEEEFSVGTGFTQEQRKRFWRQKDELSGAICKVSYQHLTTRKKVPRFLVFIEVIQ